MIQRASGAVVVAPSPSPAETSAAASLRCRVDQRVVGAVSGAYNLPAAKPTITPKSNWNWPTVGALLGFPSAILDVRREPEHGEPGCLDAHPAPQDVLVERQQVGEVVAPDRPGQPCDHMRTENTREDKLSIGGHGFLLLRLSPGIRRA